MATDLDFVEYVLEQAQLPGLTWRRMFGEFGLYLDGVFVAVAADNMLFLKLTAAVRQLLPDVVQARPYPGARPWLLVDEALDDPPRLANLFQATARELAGAGAGRKPATPATRKRPRC